MRNKRLNFSIFLVLLGWTLAASGQTSPQGITLQGRITKPDGSPLEASTVVINVEIQSPGAEDCVLFKEAHTINMSASEGLFSLIVGAGTRSGTAFEATSTLAQVFMNNSAAMTSLTCLGGITSYTPASGQARKIKLSFNDGSGDQTITETISVKSVPYALYADTLQGKAPTDFIQVKNTGAAVTQTNLDSVFASGANVTELLALIAGTSANYTKVNGSNFLPTAAVDMNSQRLTNVATPTAGTDAANRTYVDTYIGGKATDSTAIAALAAGDAGKALVWDGTKWVAAAGTATDGTKLPLTGGTMSGAIAMGGNNITGVGYLNLSAQKYLGLGSFDDSQEGTLVTSTLTPGGNSYKGATWYNSTDNVVKYWNGSAVVVVATGSTALTSLNGSTKATQTFATPGTSGTAPAWSTNTGTGVHTLNVPMASAASVTAGLISKTDYDAFAAKQSATLADGNILVGNGSNVATAVTASGDATMTNAGVVTVGKVQGKAFASTAPTDGQVYVWNNTASQWQPKNFNASNLISAAGTSQFANASCAAGQTLTWSALTDTFTCTNISITKSQVSDLGTVGDFFKDGSVAMTGALTMDQLGANPAGTASKGTMFVKSDGKLYYRDGTGTVLDLTAGNTAMTTLNGSTVQSQTFATPGTSGTAPAWSTNTGTGAHTLNVPMASAAGVTAGLLSKTDYDSFAAKQSSSLANGKILVGDAGGVAAAVTPSGDATMTNAGAVTVGKIQGNVVKSGTPSDLQVLTWVNGNTQWEPKTISITKSQVSDFPTLGTAAAKDFGVAAGNLVELDGGAKIPSALMPSGTGNFMKDGSVVMTGNIQLGGKYLSNDGGNEGISVDDSGKVGINVAAPSTDLSFGGNSARTIAMERTTTGTNGYNLTVQAGGAISGGSNRQGGDLILSSGTSTGDQGSGIYFYTASKGSGGTTDRTPDQKMHLNRDGNLGIGQGASTGDPKLVAIQDTAGYYAASFVTKYASATGIEPVARVGRHRSGGANAMSAGGGLSFDFQLSSEATSSTAVVSQFTTAWENNQVNGTTDRDAYLSFGTMANNVMGERMRIDSAGNVGIGATAPLAKLHVWDSTASTIRIDRASDQTKYGFLDYSGSSLKVGTATSDELYLQTNATNRITITAAGNVGIGVTPNEKLTVEGGMTLKQLAANPTGTAAYGSVFVKNDGKLYYRDGTGTVTDLLAGSAAVTTLNGSTVQSQTFATPGTSGTAPAWSTNTGTGVHTLDIPMASSASVTAGLLSKTDYDAFAAKQSATLADGKILVGNGSSVATAVTPSGDATMTNAGVVTVAKIHNRAIASTAPTDGQVYVWVNGSTQWQPKNFNVSNLISAAGTSQFANSSCATNQTLTWSALTDTFTCSNISITKSQVSDFGTPGDFLKDGSVSMTGNIKLGGKYLSNDGGNEGVAVDNSGNVGIGTATPGELLDVRGGTLQSKSSTTPIVAVRESASNSAEETIRLRRSRSDSTAPSSAMAGMLTLELEGYTNSDYAKAGSINWGWENNQTNDTTDRDSYIAFRTLQNNSNESTAGDERMRITSSGNVGIGTTSPTTALEVSGTVTATSFAGSGAALTGLTTTQMPAAMLVKTCEIVIGDPGAASSALANDNDSPVVCANMTGATMTILSVECYANSGTPTVTPIITGGAATSILTGALTCGNGSFAAGTLNGTPTQASGATIDGNITTAGGTAKYIVIRIKRTL